MNKSRYVLTLILGSLLLATQAFALDLGDNAPMADQTMKNANGKEVSINDVAGKNGTLVIFSCNSCPWVQAWESRMVDIGNTYQQKGIGVIFINSNDPKVKPEDSFAEMQKRADVKGYKFAYAMDETSNIAKAFGASHTPEAYLFNADGKLVYHGTIDDNARNPQQVDQHFLKNALDAMLAGKEIPENETKSLGCTIKFRS